MQVTSNKTCKKKKIPNSELVPWL